MPLPRHIIDIIFEELDNHVCPIYNIQDLNRDKAHFLEVLGYNEEKIEYMNNYEILKNKDKDKDISKEVALSLYKLDFDDFSKYEKYVKIGSLTRKKNPRLNAEELRKEILKDHNNCVVEWLVRVVYEESKILIPKWFAKYMFPIHSEFIENESFKNIGILWMFFSKNEISFTEKIINFTKKNKFLKIHEFKYNLVNEIESPIILKKMTLGFLKNIPKLYDLLQQTIETEFNKDTVSIANEIEDKLHESELTNDYWIHKFYDIIIKKESDDLNENIYEASISNFRIIAEDNGLLSKFNIFLDKWITNLNDDIYTDMDSDDDTVIQTIDLDEVAQKLNEMIDFKEFSEIFSEYDMTVVSDSDDDIIKIIDNNSDFTTDDLNKLINLDLDDISEEDDIKNLRLYFNRYNELDNILKKKKLRIRYDSKICRDYVELGIYKGPMEGVDPNSSVIERVVDMMDEMRFLYNCTEYADIMFEMNRYRDSEKAKKIALHEYNIKKRQKKKNKVKIPNRLKKIMENTTNISEIYSEYINILESDGEDNFWYNGL